MQITIKELKSLLSKYEEDLSIKFHVGNSQEFLVVESIQEILGTDFIVINLMKD